MKIRIGLLKYMFAFSAATMLVSCSKFLDKEPISAGTDENFWKSGDEANTAVSGGYALLRQALNNNRAYYAYGDFPTDQFITDLGGEDYNYVSQMNWSISVASTATARPLYTLRRYDIFYRVIDQANRCIRFIPTIPEKSFTSAQEATQEKNRFMGEAYFQRAFTYFYMGRVWGGVPIVPEGNVNLNDYELLERSTAEQVMAKAKADALKAIENLSWTNVTSIERAVRATKGAAYALLAHIEAWTGNYKESAAAADSVIAKGGYSYVPMANYLNIWKGKSTEGIFEISMNTELEGSSNSISFITLKTPYLLTYTGENVSARLDATSFRNKFPDSTDLRVKNAFAFYSSTDPNCIKYSNIQYLGQNNTIPQAQNNIVVFRYADIVLLKAEALAAIGQEGTARTLLNEIKTRANATPYAGSDAGLFEAIIDERGRELFLEGHRFYDLVRLGKVKNILKFGGSRIDASSFNAGKYYWPIEPSLIVQNFKLKQTPYWADKM